jgi:hypothetical protein
VGRVTAIAAITDGTTVWMGGDSAGVDGYDLEVRADPKVFTTGPYAIGFTSSFRMGQLLRYSLKLPQPDAGDLHRFMCTVFVDAVRDCLKEGGYARKHDENEAGGEFLVGVLGHIFKVASDYQVAERADGIDACGCGEDYVLGALWVTRDDLTPRTRLNAALGAAARFSTGVCAPFTIVSVSGVTSEGDA